MMLSRNELEQGGRKGKERQGAVEKLIRGKKVWLFQKLLRQMNCSAMTLRRDMQVIGTLTSYTHQGRFLTVKDIPIFDQQGIWFYRRIGFTKYQSSLELIVALINSSPQGLTREQLEDILRIQIFQQIQTLLRRGQLYRVKIGRKYHYLPERLARNKRKRLRLLQANEVEEYYDAKVESRDLVGLLKAVLMEKRIPMDGKSLQRFTRKYRLRIPVNKVEQLLLKYDLRAKKKRPDVGQ